MSLRLRLIVAFFLFSVVPLAAVTFYSYTSNLRALQVAAQHETEMLTGELTQRMQVVTTQISERVEHLMDMPVAASTRRHGDVRQDAASSDRPASHASRASTPFAAAPPRQHPRHRRTGRAGARRRRPLAAIDRDAIEATGRRRRSARSRCC